MEVLLERSFDVDDLAEIRGQAFEAVSAAGAVDHKARSFVGAVNEGMTNAIVHGGGGGLLTIRREGSSLAAEVRDRGEAEPFAVPATWPPVDKEGGRGLRLAWELVDRLTIWTGVPGTALVLELNLPTG